MIRTKLLGRAALALVLLGTISVVQGLEISVKMQTPSPRPSGGDIQIEATVTSSSSIKSVALIYVVNYGSEIAIPMTEDGGSGIYTATIPAEDAKPGSLVRWRISASDSAGDKSIDPPFTAPDAQEYYGTVVQDSGFTSNLPIVELYCQDERAPFNPDKTIPPQCSMLFDGAFYDNLSVRRKGQSSLNWPKPKFKVSAGSQGKLFQVSPDAAKVKQINFNSEWSEPGENTFMRETLAWETFRTMGVDYLNSFQTVVRLNGEYFGKFALSVDWTKDTLAANGYAVDPPSPMFKSESGEYSNLRWDIPADQVQYYYTQEIAGVSGDAALVELGKGLAGGGSLARSDYVFEWINLPKTINYMAAQTLVLNQDRCTKNFEVYLDPSTRQWAMLPWDIEGSFSSDRGLGGQPAADYCILACEQWNSPLYCDRNHPQDLTVKTPWGLITTQINPIVTSSSGQNGRKLLQGSSGATPGTADNGAAEQGLSLPPTSSIPQNYNDNQTKKGPTLTGAPGTFNYLIDAILEIPRTRAMYMRRLRTLMDSYITTGRLQSLVTAEYNKIKDEAKRDAAKWGNPGNPDSGYQQLITEQLPTRKEQLFNKYSVGGDTPLIPSAQPSQAALRVGEVEAGADGFVRVENENDFAVDVSGWKLNGGGVSFVFVPGTVIPSKDSVYVAAGSVGAFKSRGSGAKGGQGLFVVGPLQGSLSGGGDVSFDITAAF